MDNPIFKKGTIKELGKENSLMKVNKTLYNREAILSTAYKFTDTCYIHFESIDSENYGVFFSPITNGADVSLVVNKFCNELIDQQIRYDLNNRNKSIKELIIKKAFFPFQSGSGPSVVSGLMPPPVAYRPSPASHACRFQLALPRYRMPPPRVCPIAPVTL